jgi:hypothetical protein
MFAERAVTGWLTTERGKGAIGAAVCYAAWLTSIVFCAAHGARPLLIASASFFPVGIVHGVGIWFGGW